jgi:hypothetical protein
VSASRSRSFARNHPLRHYLLQRSTIRYNTTQQPAEPVATTLTIAAPDLSRRPWPAVERHTLLMMLEAEPAYQLSALNSEN